MTKQPTNLLVYAGMGLLIMVFSCERKSADATTADSLSTTSDSVGIAGGVLTDVRQNNAPPVLGYDEYNAIVTSEPLVIYRDTSEQDQTVVDEVEYYHQFSIEGEVEPAHVDVDQASCDSYPLRWYQVKSSSGKAGWAYGLLTRKVSQEGSYAILSASGRNSLELEGNTYYIDAAIDIGASEVIPGCPSRLILFVFDAHGTAYPISFKNKEALNPNDWLVEKDGYGNLVFVTSSEGGSATLTGAEASEYHGKPAFLLSWDHSYQEGGAYSTAYVQRAGEGFQVVNFEYHAEGEGEQEQEDTEGQEQDQSQ